MGKTGKSIYCGAAALIIFAMLRKYIGVSNVIFFVMTCGIFVVTLLLSNFLLSKVKAGENTVAEKAWRILPVVSLAVWLVLFYKNELNAGSPLKGGRVIRHIFPFPVWITITVIGTAVCLWMLGKNSPLGIKCRKAIRAVVALAFTFAASVQFYAPNIFQDTLGGTYHSHAYTNSIINVCWMIPYGDHMEALYGHYAILFMPVLKVMHRLFGVDYLTGIFIVCAAIAGISMLLFIWILNFFAENDLIFYLGMFAIGEYYFMMMKGGVYLQVHPHRMIFPILMSALALLEYKKKKEYDIVAIIINTLALVWSTEVGLVMMLAFSLYRWVQHIMDGEKLSVRKCMLLFYEIVKFFVIPFVMAYLIVNGYNLLADGNILNLEEFLFPLISERGYIGDIELPLPDVTHAWIGTAVLFLSVISLPVLRIFFPDKEKENGCLPFYFLVSVTGLGLMIYYINRAVEGSLFIIMYLMLIIQVIILQRAQKEYMEWKKDKESIWGKKNRFVFLSLRVITTLILFVMAFDSIYSMPEAWKVSKEGIWKRKELEEFVQEIYYSLPPDAVSFGEGVPEMLSMIDRDTHLHTTEWSYRNMPLDTMEKIRYDLEDEEWLFCSMYSLWIMQEEFPGLTDQFDLVTTYEYNDNSFSIFKRKE